MIAIILDGYTDEPAGLGVPPYIDVYPRYIAGAIWSVYHSAKVVYFTVDKARQNLEKFLRLASKSDLLIVIAGVIVPGKYLGGTPITFEEIVRWPRELEKTLKILVGPAARFGFGVEGGKIAFPPKIFEDIYDLIVRGDPEIVIYDLLKEKLSLERINPYKLRESYELTSKFAVRGARIVLQHPNHGHNLIAEIETYRGCPRWLAGGCSFCIEPRHGKVIFRDEEEIAREIGELYRLGLRSFRLGRQSDFLTYKAVGTNEEEFPKPNPKAIEKLYRMIRYVAPSLETLHIDNVNPGTIAKHPEEAERTLKVLIKYHTPGDVAAFGLETADPHVARLNNLGTMPEEVLTAIEIVNNIGKERGWNGLPEILPGVNFVLGLIGETKNTYRKNIAFLKEILERQLLVRRVNIRQVLPLPATRMWSVGTKIIERNYRYFKYFKNWVREKFDSYMLPRIAPKYSVLRRLYVEGTSNSYMLARQVGSYPLLTYVTEKVSRSRVDVLVVKHKARSVIAVPFPIDFNRSSFKSLKYVVSEKKALEIIARRPITSGEIVNILTKDKLKFFRVRPPQDLKCWKKDSV